jgi:hypothetical protein
MDIRIADRATITAKIKVEKMSLDFFLLDEISRSLNYGFKI